jgi:hypothetical protein
MIHVLLQALFLLVITGSAVPTKVASVKKDASEIKFIPTVQPDDVKLSPRVGRQSSALHTPASNTKYQYHLVPEPVLGSGGVASEQEDPSESGAHYTTQVQEYYKNLPQKQQQQILAAFRQAKQPKSPVYHATPLQPYGALLNHASGDQYEQKTVLVTPKPISEQYHGDQSGDEQVAGGQAYYTSSNNAVGTHTEALISEPKYAPLVYKSLQQQHESLHHREEYEEPKNVSQIKS